MKTVFFGSVLFLNIIILLSGLPIRAENALSVKAILQTKYDSQALGDNLRLIEIPEGYKVNSNAKIIEKIAIVNFVYNRDTAIVVVDNHASIPATEDATQTQGTLTDDLIAREYWEKTPSGDWEKTKIVPIHGENVKAHFITKN